MPHVIHHIDPVVFHICGPLAVRWYGLAYLLGFAASFLMLRRWSRQGGFEVPERETGHFILLLAFFGVFLGGRHGGFVGALLFVAWYARRHSHSFWNLADQLAATVSLGIGFGRLANFVNGELWGLARILHEWEVAGGLIGHPMVSMFSMRHWTVFCPIRAPAVFFRHTTSPYPRCLSACRGSTA